MNTVDPVGSTNNREMKMVGSSREDGPITFKIPKQNIVTADMSVANDHQAHPADHEVHPDITLTVQRQGNQGILSGGTTMHMIAQVIETDVITAVE